MLDVHPPHHAASTWRDFFTHIATIVVGLLIAIALEQTVEALQHRHERIEARENIRRELSENRTTLAKDLRALAEEETMLQNDIALLRQLRSHQPVARESLHFNWMWNSMEDAAWRTARETTAVALFPIDQVQSYDETYLQQSFANDAGLQLSRLLTNATVPLKIEPDLAALTPAEIDEILHSCATSLNQIDYVRTMTSTLDRDYGEILATF
jgi:hypothetical protein